MDRPNPGLYRDAEPEPLLTTDETASYDEATAGTHRHEAEVGAHRTEATGAATQRPATQPPTQTGTREDSATYPSFTDADQTDVATGTYAAGDRQLDSPATSPLEAQPAGGYAQMPAAAPSPAAGGTPPMPGDTPHMATPRTQQRFDPWNYREEAALGDGADVVGFTVETIDGHIGKIDESSTLVGDSYLVVDTGPWIFGKRVLLPAGTVNHIDSLEQKIYVDRTKSQIKDSPEFDPDQFGPEYRDKLGGYYHSTYDSTDAASDHSTWGDSRSVE